MSVFSNNLRWLRNRKGETQAKLGKAVGKSRDAVAKYETGENEPDLETLVKFSRHYSVPVDSIITDDEYVVLNTRTELAEFEKHLNDPGFIPYFRLAVKIIDYGIDVNDIDNYVESLAKYAHQDKNAKKKHQPF